VCLKSKVLFEKTGQIHLRDERTKFEALAAKPFIEFEQVIFVVLRRVNVPWAAVRK
jgi:hypothetical protein